MKLTLNTLFLAVLAFLAGAGFMRWWDVSHGIKEAAQLQALFQAEQNTDAVLDVNLQNARLADGVADTENPAQQVQQGSALPSQLSPIHLEGISEVYGKSSGPVAEGENLPAPQTVKSPVDLGGVQGQVPADTDNARQAQQATNLTMIEAPVKARVISSLDAYKAFKQTARGSYPAADFNAEQVVVLESQSNLPDKVFEIAKVAQNGENIVIFYRVNVFGLDKKTNTHSAVKTSKTDLPVVLKQVL